MSRIIRLIIQNSLYQIKNKEVKNREIRYLLISLFLTSSLFLFWYKEFWIITLIILLIVYTFREVETPYVEKKTFRGSKDIRFSLLFWENALWRQQEIAYIRIKMLLSIYVIRENLNAYIKIRRYSLYNICPSTRHILAWIKLYAWSETHHLSSDEEHHLSCESSWNKNSQC